MGKTDLDHLSSRVTMLGVIGGVSGTLAALLRGHPVLRTAGLTCMSCAMAGTACLMPERLAAWTLYSIDMANRNLSRGETLFVSHTIGGTLGGALLGTLYNGRPFNAMAVCIPIMMFVGFGESMFQDIVDEKHERRRIEMARRE